MNIGSVISFMIGGILLISILRLDASVHSRSDASTLDMMAKTNTETIADVISYDLRNTGFRVGGNAFAGLSSTSMTLFGDLDFDGNTDQVTWVYQSGQSDSSTVNPDDKYLYRIVNGDTLDFSMVVTNFNLSFFNSAGNTTANPSQVTGVHVQVACQSAEPSEDHYPEACWEKTVYPINLNL